jgi:valyl-tRNA synthetase
LSIADRWILTKHNDLIESTSRLFDNYQYGEAGRQIHDFLWFDFADWYIELSKVQLEKGDDTGEETLITLVRVFDNSLRLLHPFIPFVTEEIWQHLRSACLSSTIPQLSEMDWPEALIIADWPESGQKFEGETADFDRIRELVRGIRAVRADYKVEPKRFIPAHIAASNFTSKIESQRSTFAFLARLDDEQLEIRPELEAPPTSATITHGEVSVYLPLKDMIDLSQERTRLRAEIEDLEYQITRLSGLLGSEFSDRAPESVVQREREKLDQYEASRAQLIERLSALD